MSAVPSGQLYQYCVKCINYLVSCVFRLHTFTTLRTCCLFPKVSYFLHKMTVLCRKCFFEFLLSVLFYLRRPHTPSHNQVITETAENRAPPSEHGSISTVSSGSEARKSVTNSTSDSASECQETTGSDPDKASFTPGHSRSFSEPSYSNHNRSIGQLSRISGYSTGHSFSSSLEGRSSRRYCLRVVLHTVQLCTFHFCFVFVLHCNLFLCFQWFLAWYILLCWRGYVIIDSLTFGRKSKLHTVQYMVVEQQDLVLTNFKVNYKWRHTHVQESVQTEGENSFFTWHLHFTFCVNWRFCYFDSFLTYMFIIS